MSELIEFRWLQKEDYDGNPVGNPVLQWRCKLRDAENGHVSTLWNFPSWETIPTVFESAE